jgi:2-polyprenyl-6-methoxyphenol hydroxylase-like FAD-dependent oxidoreductase
VLIGDAAHAVSPNAGQGASMALEDAMYLARLLRDGDDYEEVFARFEQDRKPRVERIVAEGRRRGTDKQIVGPVQARIRELMIAVFVNLFGPRGDDWLHSYRVDWTADVPVGDHRAPTGRGWASWSAQRGPTSPGSRSRPTTKD